MSFLRKTPGTNPLKFFLAILPASGSAPQKYPCLDAFPEFTSRACSSQNSSYIRIIIIQEGTMMKAKSILLAIAFLAAVATAPRAESRNDLDRTPSFSMSDEDRGPSFSSPPEGMAQNGDRVGHYPPYYYPEGDGH
jgi:hypothetical protein